MNLYQALIFNNTWKFFTSNLSVKELYKMLSENDFYIERNVTTKKEIIYNVNSIKTIEICDLEKRSVESSGYEISIIEFI